MAINKIPQRAFDNDDMLVDVYTATAGQTVFTMSRAAAVNSVLVHVNDVIQQPTVDYTVSGTTLTFTSGLSVNDDVRIRMMTERPLGSQSGGSGATTLGALNDVSSATPATGQVLKWNGTQWGPDTDATGGGGSSLTIQDEGVALSTAATTLNFVGSGITASGTGATKTITVTGSGGSGIALTDLSIASEGTASGDGSIAYNNTNGQFTYTPPTLNGLSNAGDVDFGTNKILYSNHYANLVDLPSASTYHGMFAHVHGTGKAYYAHAGNWVALAAESQLTLDGLTGVSTTGVTSGQVLKYNGTSWAPAADSSGSGGIALGDLSVGAEGTASGDGSLAYNNSTGVFTYTPPIIPSVALPDDQEFGVTNNGASAYTFSGAATGDNPTITLQRGKTYRFDVNASGHPFAIRLSSGGSAYTNGVENANAQVGAIYFTVPDNAPDSLVYQCTVHASMVGTINVIDKIIPGHVIQAASSSLNAAVSTSGTTFTDTGLTVTLTPRQSTSKFLIIVDLGLVSTGTADGVMFRLMRNSTQIGQSTGANNHNNFMQFYPPNNSVFLGASNHFYDTPSTTNQITYKLQWAMTGSTNTGFINRRNSDNYARTTSNFTVQEIAD